MNVENIMSKNVVTVNMNDSLIIVKEIFDNTRFHHLLVTESGKLFGIISDRDLLKTISPNIGTASETSWDTETLNQKAHQIMTRELVTLKPDAQINSAIHIFNHHNISCIPIINDENEPVGILGWRDILKTLEFVS